MKGPLELRHTSSERARPTACEHAPAYQPIRARAASDVGRALRTGVQRSLATRSIHTCSGRLTPVMHLSERSPRALNLRLDHGRCHSEIEARPCLASCTFFDAPPVERTSYAPWPPRDDLVA
jgi:hypothetical protein